MKYPHTGLYHFCWHLGRNLQQVLPAGQQLCFYTPPSARGLFGKDACYLEQTSLQKFWLPSTSRFSIWHNTYQSSMYFPKRSRLRTIVTIHDLNVLYDDTKNAARKERYLRDIGDKIRRADHVVAISKYTLTDVMTHLDTGNKPCSIIYNGCNIEPIENPARPSLAPGARFLFTIGTIVDKKNFHVLPCLLADNDLYLVIAGITQSESYKSRIIHEAHACGVADRVLFTGPISESDKQWYLRNCTAFLFPSTAEGFGLPVVEAMHFGKPALLSTATSLPEIGGDAAYYFHSFDPVDMQRTLADSLRDYETNDRAAAIMAQSNRFSWRESAQQYSAVYQSLLEG
ncbi:MAG: glycosyl transferase group 1 [Flaviaesturariibacter sp.]|nr:glycosyl transferase group 1 [Flaviaesturariibacter sp.]